MSELQQTYPHRSWQHISSDIRKKKNHQCFSPK
ncbi:hypothetical protein T11_14001 [Trichinella zimbabwensis]|uniref:Uncharacterized protein n=1 Tax=Trichinella zimbabwensis TaxID=268475 RepID=A0A0V1G926_9BILA|nr:hypothetical protein T11_14001 [Trichinella zimbabwensis]